MRQKEYLIPTMAGLILGGGLGAEGCAPMPRNSGGGGDDDDSVAAFLGDWELRRWGDTDYPYRSTYATYSNYSYSYESCVQDLEYELRAEADGDAELRSRTTSTGYCPYAYSPGTTVYDGRWTEQSAGSWRITLDDLSLRLTCSVDGDTLECDDDDGARVEFDRL